MNAALFKLFYKGVCNPVFIFCNKDNRFFRQADFCAVVKPDLVDGVSFEADDLAGQRLFIRRGLPGGIVTN